LWARPETAAEYARLKHELAARAGDDRAPYPVTKGRFVRGAGAGRGFGA
jgi:GrpB-like predicted nucleotidyltransferase (UPF0157 family)